MSQPSGSGECYLLLALPFPVRPVFPVFPSHALTLEIVDAVYLISQWVRRVHTERSTVSPNRRLWHFMLETTKNPILESLTGTDSTISVFYSYTSPVTCSLVMRRNMTDFGVLCGATALVSPLNPSIHLMILFSSLAFNLVQAEQRAMNDFVDCSSLKTRLYGITARRRVEDIQSMTIRHLSNYVEVLLISFVYL